MNHESRLMEVTMRMVWQRASRRRGTVARLGIASLVLAGSMGGPATAWAQQARPASTRVTFTKDVAPILQARCQSCHRPGTVAPMSLLTYQDARPWARAIKERVVRREMPPWHYDKTVGIQKLKGDISLTDEQIATIAAWVDAGAPMGDPKDMPRPLVFNDDVWTIGTPDLVITAPSDAVYAEGPDWWVNRNVDSGLTEDRYIKAVETRVSKEGRPVVHHAIATLLQEESEPQSRRGGRTVLSGPVINIDEGSYLSEYAVGKYGDIFPDGAGRVIRGGAKVRFNMHYHAVGKQTTATTSVGFVFYPRGEKPKRFITDVFPHENDTIDIPPGQMTRTDVYYPLPKAARLIGFQPHMHMRGKAMCMEAIYLDGSREMLSCVDRFDFNWHVMYTYQDDATPLLPKGTTIHLIAIHDNTTTSRRNPDPTLWVGWGQRSIDDMAAAHINTEFMEDADFERAVAERKAQRGKTIATQQQP
jgi:mono/diheme cytochrome c family protein